MTSVLYTTLSPQVINGNYSERTDEWGIGVIAFILLTGGKKPFDADKSFQVREEIKQGVYSMDGPEWDEVSHEAKAFVASLLEYNEERRITAEEALQSPWITSFQQDAKGNDEADITSIADALASCIEEPKLKRLSMMIIAHDTPEQQIEELRAAFDTLDVTKDGTISLEEFQTTIKNNSTMALNDGEWRKIFEELDMNKTGVISYHDFLAATLERHCNVNEDMIANAFDTLAVDGNTTIQKENIETLLGVGDTSKGKKDSKDDAQEIMLEVSDNGDKIDFETFSAMFKDSTGS